MDFRIPYLYSYQHGIARKSIPNPPFGHLLCRMDRNRSCRNRFSRNNRIPRTRHILASILHLYSNHLNHRAQDSIIVSLPYSKNQNVILKIRKHFAQSKKVCNFALQTREKSCSAMPRWRNGRRARFRCECCEACRFESCSGHPCIPQLFDFQESRDFFLVFVYRLSTKIFY